METTTSNQQKRNINDIMKRIPETDYLKTEMKLLIASKIGDLIASNETKKQEFAAKVGVSSSVVSKWLRGDHNFTTDTLVEIGHALGFNFFSIGRISKSHNNISSDWISIPIKNKRQALLSCSYDVSLPTNIHQISVKAEWEEINSEV